MGIKISSKKKSITLVELLISITMTSALMILLFSVITKKASVIAYHDKGTYYCWKDWYGNLYQKAPSGNIHKVNECGVKVPRNAKNIKAYLIGGGSGGYVYNNNNISVSYSSPRFSNKRRDCCVVKNDNDTACEFKPIDDEKYFDIDFSKDLANNGNCFGEFSEGDVFYKIDTDGRHSEQNSSYSADINFLTIEIINPISIKYVTPNPGKYTAVSVQAGREYLIRKEDIGSGGDEGKIGNKTRFLDDNIAEGGGFSKQAPENIDISPEFKPISSISNLSTIYSHNICKNSPNGCKGKFVDDLKIIPDIEYKSDIIIDKNFDINKEDDVTKTGFGLFGASGPNKDCRIEYYPVRQIKYNDLVKDNRGHNANIRCKNSFSKGMGGAIIIKWE